MEYDSRFRSPETDSLFEAVLSLEDTGECYRFFEDLMTIKELQDISQRWQVARLLAAGRTYTEIASETGASAATISRVSRCLSYGAEGYARVLKKLEEKSPETSEKDL